MPTCDQGRISVQKRYPSVVLRKGRERALLQGHPWIFSGAIERVMGNPEAGEVVCVYSHRGEPVALAFYHPHADIALRVLSRHTEIEINREFLQHRIRKANELRKKVIKGDTSAFRVINSEGDGVPGLIVDKYGEYLVVSFETLGAQRRRGEIVDALIDILSPRGIYERSQSGARKKEGLSIEQGRLWGEEPPEMVEIRENGLKFFVDVKGGQKTGFFLDQRDNRKLFHALSWGARVLNCFSYTGGFSIYALKGGAREVVSVETSEAALRLINSHISANGLDGGRHRMECADVFDYLRADDSSYDLICLDPPSFARTQREVGRALKGYREINRQAIRRLKPGGILITFSCSGAVREEAFYRAVQEGAIEAGSALQLLRFLGPAADHPTQFAHREGRYLKGLMLSILEREGS